MASRSEFEIKLSLAPEAAQRISAFASRYSSKPRTTRMRTTYFDDKKHSLARRGLELRVRESDGRRTQTVKAGGGVHRGEWETDIDADAPSLKALKNTPAKAELKKIGKLHPVFDIDVKRRTWTVYDDGAEIELAMDTGEILCGDKHERISEAEFELKRGPSDAVYFLVGEAIASSDATPSFVSKGARGQRLAAGVERRPESEIGVRLEPDATVADAFAAVIAACLRQGSISQELFSANPSDSEAVHELRVAIRRLRAAFSLFRDALRRQEAQRLEGELKWISDTLGHARDLDVFMQGLVDVARRKHPDVDGVEELSREFESLREEAYERLARAIHSLRFRRLLLDVAGAGAIADRALKRDALNAKFQTLARREYQRRLRKITKKKTHGLLLGPDERLRHRMRIKMKKLRYMIEFAQALAPRKGFRIVADALKQAQKALGALHDRVAAEQALSYLVAKNADAKLAFAATVFREEIAPATENARKASQAYAVLRRSAPFWNDFD